MPKRSTTAADLREHFGSAGFTVAQAASAGISLSRLNDACRAGRIRRVGRGSYVVATDREGIDDYLDVLRGVIAARPGHVVAGVSAAAVWGLPCPDTWRDWSRLPVTVASEQRARLPKGATGFRLGNRDWGMQGGLPVTGLVPTAIDVAWQLPEPNALIVVDAVARRLVGREDRMARASARERIRARLLSELAGQNRRPGSVRIARTLSWADPSADSPPESYFRGHVLLSEIPEPAVNAPVAGVSGRVYYADLYWPRDRFIVEIDGRIKYTEGAVLLAEKAREDDLRAAGYAFRRIRADDVFAHAPALVQRLRAGLAA